VGSNFEKFALFEKRKVYYVIGLKQFLLKAVISFTFFY